MKTWRHSAVRGFTLIEIMVAVALFGLVVTAIYSSWMAILRASKVGQEAAADAQRSRISMRVMETALTSACLFAANGSYYGFEAESGSRAKLSFVARLPRSFPRSGRFGDLEVRRITFSVEAGSDSGKQLVMRQSPLLMEVDEDEENYPLVLARNVQELRLEFWDRPRGRWIEEWNQTNQLPPMVKISLQLGQGSAYSTQAREEIVRVVGLPSSGVQAVWQVAGMAPVPGGPPGPPNLPPGQPGMPPGMLPRPGMPGILPGSGVPQGGFQPQDQPR